MINILNATCSDYALSQILSIIQKVIYVIRLVVPILLILGGTIIFVKYFFDPENKKLMKAFINAIASAIIVIFLPFIINVTMALISTYGGVGLRENGNNVALNVSSCWTQAGIDQSTMNSANSKTTTSISSEKK